MDRTSTPVPAATTLALVATGAALVAVCSQLAVPVGSVGVPVTLQTFAVLLVGLALGPVRGAAALGLYLLVGAVGFPVFALGSGGLGVITGPTAGYLLSFPLAAFAAGAVRQSLARVRWSAVGTVAGALLGIALVYAVGIPVLAWRADLAIGTAAASNVVFILPELAKVILAVAGASAVQRAFPVLAARRRLATS